jgi:NAD(P)-dependent dehydrogenase (short-subunit alcohol dehydrogenase family)
VNALDLTGRTALVTGSSDGIGAGIADALMEKGARVIRHGLETRPPRGIAEADWIDGDLAQPEGGAVLAKRVVARASQIDILVSAVAIQTRASFAEITSQDVIQTMTVNLAAGFALMQALIPPMASRGWGRVVTIGSVQQRRPRSDMPIYAATKAGQAHLAANLARQVAARGVTINNVAPGVVLTGRNAEVLAESAYREDVLAEIPAGRFGAVEEVGALVAYLCSPAAAYITGQDIAIDGGMGA